MKDKQEHAIVKENIAVPPQEQTVSVVSGKAEDLVSFSLSPGATVSGSFTVTGVVRNAYFFEGNILINILDADKQVLKKGRGTATSDWMTTGPVSFTAVIDVTGLQTGNGFIQISNDNPSGDSTKDRSIYMPVIIQ